MKEQSRADDADDLDVCFDRLRVGQKRRAALIPSSKKQLKAKHGPGNGVPRSVPKKLLQDPKLLLPEELKPKLKMKCITNSGTLAESKSADQEPTINSKTEQKLPNLSIENSVSEPVVCCGMQHVASNSLSLAQVSRASDDTSPEELAAYFEQLLHIPKPMSTMAEMMYA